MRSVEVARGCWIAADPEQAFALSLDTEAFPQWFRGKGLVPAVERIRRLDNGPLQVGSRRRIENSDGTSLEETVLELSPPQRHRYRVTGFAAPFRWWVSSAEADWEWTAQKAGVQVCWRYRFQVRGWLAQRIVGWIVQHYFAPAMQECLAALAASAEGLAPNAEHQSLSAATNSMHSG